MSKPKYVEFTGILPKQLQGAKKPLYGTVVKKSKTGLLTIKPKYRDYEVTVDKADVKTIPESKFHKKHKKKKPSTTKKPLAKKTVVKKEDKPTPKAPVKKVVAKVDKPCDTKKELKPKNERIYKAVETAKAEVPKPKEPFVTDPAEKLIPTPEPVTIPKLVHEEPVVKRDPINKPKDDSAMPKRDPEMEEFLDNQDSQHGGVIWGVIAIAMAVAIGAYFLFFN